MAGIVYLLTNSSMLGLVKIGKTGRDSAQVRMAELYSAGVPVPFECAKAIKVENEAAVERALHTAFRPYQINRQREFFEIDSIQAEALLDLLGGEDVTPQVNAENDALDSESRNAAKSLKTRRPNLNFEELSIPVGAELCFVDSEETAEVIGARQVIFREEAMSLTMATKIARDLDYSVQPTPYWRFQGELLRDIYNRTYIHLDD